MEKPALQSRALDAVTDEQWTEMWHKLRLHTHKRYFYLHKSLGLDLDDLVQQAIVDTMEGRRRWPPIDTQTGIIRDDVTLFQFLCGVVKSNASHLSAQQARNVYIEEVDPTSRGNAIPQSLEAILDESSHQYLFLIESETIEQRTHYNEMTEQICKLVAEDKELVSIITEWRKDPALKPNELARILGWHIEKFRAAQKRLRRKAQELKGDLTNARN